jgi:hypothetical protein
VIHGGRFLKLPLGDLLDGSTPDRLALRRCAGGSRPDYLSAWWKVIAWDVVDERFHDPCWPMNILLANGAGSVVAEAAGAVSGLDRPRP